ncbi:hypothetical protein SLEP1_g53605 [Rubroshorea leprosula]|uniref:NB-ARC domain-containing protein n=1 Tax=Rubroshorea leprosula TaxID=152421 RepID=A0AAV5M9T7_9ROSI|nr:hypothetical protein SLEP1_g53605 [Rubroshorea leprosula]
MDNIKSATDIVKDVGPAVWKSVKYQFCPSEFVEKFEAKQNKLKRQLQDVEAELNTQLNRPAKKARSQVDNWLEEARKETAVKVEDLICKEGYFKNIRSSRKLDKKTQALNGVCMQGENYTNGGQSLVIDDHSIKGVSHLIEECRGRDDIRDQILEWLKGDEVTRIAVSGMGGVGKTTIMKQVHNQLLKKRIASSLELKLEPEDHENETKLAGLISQKLRQGNFVVILDDVWQQFCLEEVGIPILDGNNGCKLVLTTRLQDVARAMECEVIFVNPLPNNEASALFLEKVGSDVFSDGKIKRDIEPFFKLILQKCGGVPLAIVTVAKSMRGKPLPRHWKLALSKFSKFESIFDCLKFSYESLEPQCQECFLYCALYPEDYAIPKEELIEYWIEEGFIYKEGETREAMNWDGHGILDKLVDNCLLESVKKEEEEDCVSMHDLLREMALEISPQFLVKAGIAKKLPEEHEWKENLLKVSLMRNYITKIPSSMPPPKCPMLTTLLLSNNNISTILEAFFEHMLGLKILDLSWNTGLRRLPSSVSKLEKLTTLLLNNCHSLREVPSLSNLVGLKKLDLSGTSIEELPQGLNILTNLKYLSLGGRLSETLDEPLQNLSKLQHLSVIAHPYAETEFKWETIGIWGKLQNLELLDLHFLHNLNMVFGEVGAVAESAPLPVGTFSSLQYISVIGCDKIKMLFLVRWLGYLQKLQTIFVSNCKQLKEIIGFESEEGEKVTLPKLESLSLFYLPQLKSIYSGSLICDSIKEITIRACKNIESVFWSGFNPLPNLEYLYLSRLENLKCVFDEEGLGLSPLVPPTSFFSLKEIRVLNCDQLKKVFSSGWLLRYFQSLQTIKVKECLQMEELISSLAHEEEKVTLPKLERLKLIDLPQLKSIYSSSLIFDSIKKIKIQNCYNIERVFWSGFNPLPNLEYLELSYLENLKCVFDEEGLGLSPLVPLTSFFSLKEIRVLGCARLKKVFSSGWLLRYFQSLETIKVSYCKEMEELISSSAHEEEKVTLPKLQGLHLTRFNPLPNLEYLHLSCLWNLKSLFDEEGLGLSPLVPPTSCFSLKEIRVVGCGQLKKLFSSGWLLCYFQSLEILKVEGCWEMEELISSSAHEEEKVTLPKLQSLTLIRMWALKSICNRSNVLICDSIQSLRISTCKKLKRIPLNFPLLDNAQSSHPPSLKEIVVFPKEWWESLE